jgi:hypothetical protein
VPIDPYTGVISGPVSETDRKRDIVGLASPAVAAVVLIAATAGRTVAGRMSVVALAAVSLAAATVVAGVWLTNRRGRGAPVRRFRLQPADGRTTEYVVDGPGRLRSGDLVRVTGVRTRGGEHRVHRVEVLAALDGPRLAEIPGRSPYADLVPPALAAAMLVLSVVLVVAG